MRKISIVQRRLETGLDLTQAELRALQREARIQPDQAAPPGETATAVMDPISVLPPTRPAESSQDRNQVEKTAWEREGILADGSTGEPGEKSPVSDRGNTSPIYTEERHSDIEERRGEEDLFSSIEPTWTRHRGSDGLKTPESGAGSERDVLFPRQEQEIEFSINESDHITGSSPGAPPVPDSEFVVKEDTLVLFLLQVPANSRLAATFSASQNGHSPFGGQLRLHTEGEDSGVFGEASKFDVNLPPKGLVRLSTGKVVNNGHEWALISLDEEAHQYATFDLQAGRNLKATAAVFSKSPSRKGSVPLRVNEADDCGLVVANPTDKPVVVKVSLVDEDGCSVAHQELVPLPAGKQIVVFSRSVFQGVSGISSFKGEMVAEVLREGLIWTAGLDQNNGVLSFLPVKEAGCSVRP